MVFTKPFLNFAVRREVGGVRKCLMHLDVEWVHERYKKFLKKRPIGAVRTKKGQTSSAKSLSENNRPNYTLDHIVKERYPTFVDALRDMDDAISMLYLFSKMPVDSRIKAKTVKSCQTLIAEFQNYVMNAKCLRKVFFSIKGIYYQADIKGQTITWIVPYQFSTDVYSHRRRLPCDDHLLGLLHYFDGIRELSTIQRTQHVLPTCFGQGLIQIG
ncbi:hypothetical protein [Absidia glauca]|uniref:Uncharacterized protein n=1 Tax=Absidia glauca TaxID=4829 RepID=A0A168PB06_ABSGL|nr:hypothetical protein [Absidia glauca]